MKTVTERQIEKALEWMKNHPEKGSSVSERAQQASWRFHVDQIDLLEAWRIKNGGS
jgi:hypothetical protein